MTLTHEQQIERFGMTTKQARAIRNKAEKACPDLSAARKAWQDLSYELRGDKGQPFQCPRHPEAIRLKMLECIADGETVARSVEIAREFAFS